MNRADIKEYKKAYYAANKDEILAKRNYRHFIYIPKSLHLEIHQYLRENGIDADSNHYAQIEHIIIKYYKQNDKHFLVL